MISLEEFKKGAGRLLVLDVESIGLHGEAFAFGYVVVTANGPIAETFHCCDPETAQGSAEDRKWVMENIPRMDSTHASPKELRDQFWKSWNTWREEGAVIVADCAWPVEARFLAQCVDDDPATRCWQGPYPLLDLSAFLWAGGINPLSPQARHPGELPLHHPMMDARQSARLLLDVLLR